MLADDVSFADGGPAERSGFAGEVGDGEPVTVAVVDASV